MCSRSFNQIRVHFDCYFFHQDNIQNWLSFHLISELLKMKDFKVGIFSVLVALQFATGGAQYYGSFGRSAYLRPISFPPIQQPHLQYLQSSQNLQSPHSVPLFNRLNPDNPQLGQPQFSQQAPITANVQPVQTTTPNRTQLVDAGISHGAEMFSFEMFRVSWSRTNIIFFSNSNS